MKKRKLSIIILVIISIILFTIYKLYDMGRYTIKNKDDLKEYVINDESELSSIVELICSYNDKNIHVINKTSENDYRKLNNTILNKIFYKYKLNAIGNRYDTGTIWFYLERHKKMTSYWGFYYTKEDNPKGYFNNTDLVADGNGYKENNDITQYYTEKILPNWYYFEIYWKHALNL